MLKIGSTARGSIWMLTGFAACPCHLPVTVPILLGLTAGTALGAFLANNLWLLGTISTAYFLFALVLGFRSLRQDRGSNAPDSTQTDETEFACCQMDDDAPRALGLVAPAGAGVLETPGRDKQ
jgi:mercuric ion transport protein